MKMANVFAAYIDSSDTWGFQQESYDSQIGFYTNAWVNNSRESTEETTTHPCSYFYQVGKEDEVGFTPTRITINDTNGILTVAGRQKNVASILSKSFRVSSPSPRFFNLRESLRNRRPARIIVSNIVTDSDAELTNIKDYLGLNEEEAEAISRSEEFGADTHYRNYDGYFANKPELENLHRCITNYLRNERPIRDSLQGDLEYESFDDRFRQSLMDAIRQIEGKLSYGAEEFGADNFCDTCGSKDKNPTSEGACDECECIESGCDSPKSGKSYSYCERCYERDNPDFEPGDYDRSGYYSEEFGAEETCPMCKKDNPIIGGEVCAECTQYLEDEQDIFSQSSWVWYAAEEEDWQKANRIMKLLRIVARKATGSNARYAKNYAKEAESAYYQYGMEGLTTQVAYVLSNLSGWRGDEAKSVKAELRKLVK
tara:strand:- start:1045 stop:2325 length:1281 start_codon:yes stop_codon:yes gene_type:complete